MNLLSSDSGNSAPARKPRVGVSTCLLGERVRYDGGHKLDRYITDTLGDFFEWLPVCPEVECGLPIPRESMDLVGQPDSPRLITTRTKIDHTDRMLKWAKNRVKELESEDLCGFIFKSNSPSSGMQRVRIYDKNGVPHKIGVGIFARVFIEHFPLLPVEDDGRLHDIRIRENFIERIFCLTRYRQFLTSDGSVRGLVSFHTTHKMLLMAHSPQIDRQLGRLVAHAKKYSRAELLNSYQALMLKALKLTATAKKNANVLIHMMGFLKKHLTHDEKEEMLEVIQQYKQELIPLIVPVTLMRHYVRKYDIAYLEQQAYLDPHPVELKLRNHA